MPTPKSTGIEIALVTEADLDDLLPLMRAYCDFYRVHPGDGQLLGLARSLIAEPQMEGVQLLARGAGSAALGFATLFWTWSTLSASRIGVMNDLFVIPRARGLGVGEALIEACLGLCRERGASSLGWQTARENLPAQRLYERVGARREEWIDYVLEVTSSADEARP